MARQLTLALTPAQEQELIQHRDHDARYDIRERCAAILKIASGCSPHWVAKHGLLQERDPDAVYGWLRWYRQAGLAGLLTHRHGGDRRRHL
jgi:hypothetical protein